MNTKQLDLQKERHKLNLTQQEMADLLNIGLRGYQKWERDNIVPDNKLSFVVDRIKTYKSEQKNTSKSPLVEKGENTLEAITGYYFPDVSASAGLNDELDNGSLNKIPVEIPGWEKGIIFINVFGDSMYPKYNSGEIIGVKPIEFEYINYGYAYVVVFENGDVFIKIVQPGSDNDHLLLESVNSFYKPKEFHVSLIKEFYTIKGVIKKEMM